MSFILKVACEVGSGKLNTGIDFGARPATLRGVVDVIEGLYSTELRVHRGDPAARFRCVSLTLAQAGGWTEVLSVDQLFHNAQLFAFDWSSPAPSTGALPTVQFTVTSQQVMKVAGMPMTAALPPTSPPAESAAPSAQAHERRPEPSQPINRSDGAFRFDSTRSFSLPNSETNQNARTRLPPEAREYLFDQLCRASGSADTVSTQRLHSIFLEYGLGLSTEEFSRMVQSQYSLDRSTWSLLEREYGPVVDALYDRIATRTAAERSSTSIHGQHRAVEAIVDDLRAAEEEEARLMAQQAALKLRVSELQRELKAAELQRNSAVPAQRR
jgi:hypothetical protein